MRSKFVLVPAVIVLTVLAVGVGISLSAEDITSPTTLRFRDQTVQDRFLDADGSHSPTLGDQFVFTDVLKRNGNVVGHLFGHCTLTGKHPARFECDATAKLRSGKITVQTAFVDDARSFTIAVTGGTGLYRNVRGQAVLETVDNAPDILTMNLLP